MPKYRVWDEYAVIQRWETVVEADNEDEASDKYDEWRESHPEPTSVEFLNNSEYSDIEEVES